MFTTPEVFPSGRSALGFDQVECGAGGIVLLKPSELEDGQVGYSVDPKGKSLAGEDDGDWSLDWIVIGTETACGDPIFMSTNPPYPVFTSIAGESAWQAKLVAPSLDSFWKCVDTFRQIASGRANPTQLEANPLSDEQIDGYQRNVAGLCGGNEDAIDFWNVQAEIGMGS